MIDTLTTIEKISNSYSYKEFESLVIKLAAESSNTGEKTTERISATKLNAHRLKRIYKQSVLNSELTTTLNNFKLNCVWILISESWCGDGAQCIPVIAKIAEQAPNIELKLILRDENIELIDRYSTNGTRSVPKLICINKNTNTEIGTWGPRPENIQKKVLEFKRNNPNASHDEFVTNLHFWYAKDETNSLQNEFVGVLKSWNTNL